MLEDPVGRTVVVLLASGDKRSRDDDIATVLRLARNAEHERGPPARAMRPVSGFCIRVSTMFSSTQASVRFTARSYAS